MYQVMRYTSNHLSIPPLVISKFNGIELFGSPLNTRGMFCSPFSYEKKFFSSLGSFFKYNLENGKTYIANPPFDEFIMKRMSKRLNNQLERLSVTSGRTNVIITIPAWDRETMMKLYGAKIDKEYDCYNNLIGSQFFRGKYLMKNEEGFKYYNYYSNKYSPIPATYLILLSCGESTNFDESTIEIKKIASYWKSLRI
jgi:hypothetical protein